MRSAATGTRRAARVHRQRFAVAAAAGIALAGLAMGGCNGGAAATDAGVPCRTMADCPGGPPQICVAPTGSSGMGVCVPACDTPCGYTGQDNEPPQCCSSNQVCCSFGESQGCFDGKSCPTFRWCSPSDNPWFDVCSDTYCLFVASSGPADAGAGDAGADGGGAGDGGAAACLVHSEDEGCIADCPAAQRCGDSDCCGAGTHCKGTCCVAN